MATLTETAYHSKRAIKFGILGLIVLIIFKSIFSAGLAYWRKLNPPPPPPPTVSFGKLPQIEFPESKFKEEKLVYRLETTIGGTPNLGDRANVYFIPTKRSSLLTLERAKTQARKMGFSGEEEKISETIYQWQTEELFLTTLKMDIVNGNFTIQKKWQEDQTLLAERMLPIKEQAVIEAKNFLQTSGFPTEDFQVDEASVSFLRFIAPNLLPVISLSEADFVKVNLFRENLNSLPVFPPSPEEALVSILFSGSRNREKRILEVNYTHFPIIEETFSTYPLKTSAQAWEELKAGEGFIANLGETETEIVIRKIYLAYFENNSPQNYLQPIYVFENSNNFVAYVSAISSEWAD